LKATEKYLREKVEDIKIRVPKGQKQMIRDFASSNVESLNAFIIRLVNEAIKKGG
jgi:uncharacterized protein (DUF1778 family)